MAPTLKPVKRKVHACAQCRRLKVRSFACVDMLSLNQSIPMDVRGSDIQHMC